MNKVLKFVGGAVVAVAAVAAVGAKTASDYHWGYVAPTPIVTTTPTPTTAPTASPTVISGPTAPAYVQEFVAHFCASDIVYLAAHSVSPQPTTLVEWASRIARQNSDCQGYEYAGATSTGYAYLIKFVDGAKVMYLLEFTGEKFSGVY